MITNLSLFKYFESSLGSDSLALETKFEVSKMFIIKNHTTSCQTIVRFMLSVKVRNKKVCVQL